MTLLLRTERSPVPFTVIGGFLGAGKTTLLNHMLRDNFGQRIAVLVNDFGAINIDAALIEWTESNTIALSNGCICCGLSNGLIDALPPLLERSPPFDHIVVEASGVADPAKVAHYGTLPGLRVDSVIVLADAETIRANAADQRIGRQIVLQLKAADLLVLSKGDLVGPAAVAETRRWLTETVGPVPIVEAVEGRMANEILLGQIGQIGQIRQIGRVGRREDDDAAASSPVQYESRSYQAVELLQGAALRGFLDSLSTNVLRVKGVLRLRESPDDQTTVHRVGSRQRLTTRRRPRDPSEPPGRLVLVALTDALDGVDQRAARIGLHRC